MKHTKGKNLWTLAKAVFEWATVMVKYGFSTKAVRLVRFLRLILSQPLNHFTIVDFNHPRSGAPVERLDCNGRLERLNALRLRKEYGLIKCFGFRTAKRSVQKI